MESISGPADYKLVEYDDLRPGAKVGIFGPTGLLFGPYTVNRVEKAEFFVEWRGDGRTRFALRVWGIPGPYFGSPKTYDKAERQLRLICPAPDATSPMPRLATLGDLIKGAVVQRGALDGSAPSGAKYTLSKTYANGGYAPKIQTDKGPLFIRDHGIIPPGYEANVPVPQATLWLIKPGEKEAPSGPKERKKT